MAKTIFETTTTLYPRLDKSHSEVAAETIHTLLVDNPAYRSCWLEANFTEHSTGEATLHIKIKDPKLSFLPENVRVILWVIAVMIITLGLVYL